MLFLVFLMLFQNMNTSWSKWSLWHVHCTNKITYLNIKWARGNYWYTSCVYIFFKSNLRAWDIWACSLFLLIKWRYCYTVDNLANNYLASTRSNFFLLGIPYIWYIGLICHSLIIRQAQSIVLNFHRSSDSDFIMNLQFLIVQEKWMGQFA